MERKATPRDLLQKQNWLQKEEEILEYCRNEAAHLIHPTVRIIYDEISFDGNRATIYYSSETEEKSDFKNVRIAIQKKFNFPQVEFRQIGPRDVAKCIGGLGVCGLETRCCSKFLTEFNSISIRMAKEQGISLTPTEITGMCGRLRCCLIYEYDNYVQLRKMLPKRNSMVKTPLGEGKVVDVYPLQQSVLVNIPETGLKEFQRSEIQFSVSGQVLKEEVEEKIEESNKDGFVNGEN